MGWRQDVIRNKLRDMSPEDKADLALALSIYAVAVASHRPRRKSLSDRLWDLI